MPVTSIGARPAPIDRGHREPLDRLTLKDTFMTQATFLPGRAHPLSDLAGRGAGFRTRVLARLALWIRRRRERRQLLAMSELQRRDIGITRLDVWREINKPFWFG